MELSFELILVASLVLVFNVLDSVTTHLAFKQYPDKELKGEGNPIMRGLMLKNKTLAEVFKQGLVLAWCVYAIATQEMQVLRLLSLMLGLVVLNNAFVVVSRAVTKRKVVTPFERLRRLLHVPQKYAYIMMVVVLIGLSYAVSGIIWGQG